MPKKYNIYLVDAGIYQDKIISYLVSYTGLGSDQISSLLDRLPVLIKTTKSRLEATIIKEALEGLGASIDVSDESSDYDSEDYSDHNNNYSYNNNEDSETNYIHRRQTDQQANVNPVTTWNTKGPLSIVLGSYSYHDEAEHEGPIKGQSGCALIVITGILLFISGVFFIITTLV